MHRSLTGLARRLYRGAVAYRHVESISQFHRIQASPGYRAAAAYVAGELARAGLDVTVHSYPARQDVDFWGCPGFQEWDCEEASLDLLDERGAPSERLCDFQAVPISLIQRSIPVDGVFEVIAPGGQGGGEPGDYDGMDVAGKVVLTTAPAARVLDLAVRGRGAAGIIYYGLNSGGRTELDLPDARQYTSFWYPLGDTPDGWGFVLSPRQGRRLRRMLERGETVRVKANVRSRVYDGEIEVVDAAIPGETDEEVLLVAHLCHPRPGAHDNASGAGALIEAAATLVRLYADGALPRPPRGIRFLWVPEMTGTFAWLRAHQADVAAGRWIAGLNLDMVGADQNVTGSTWELVGLPQAGAGFADHLLSWLRTPLVDGQRHCEPGFAGGSDHFILSDPSVGIQTPMLNQWPDKFYHTSEDTLDKVSVDSLGRSGALAAAYAAWLAAAGEEEAAWLGGLMVRRFAAESGRRAAGTVEEMLAAGAPGAARFAAAYRHRSAFAVDRISAALDTLVRLAPTVAAALPGLKAQAAAAAKADDTWVASLPAGEMLPAEQDEPWRMEAGALIPRRCFPGPSEMHQWIRRRPPEEREAYRALEASTENLHDVGALLEYWCDGRRTIAEIGGYVELETGTAQGDLPLRYFRLLAAAEIVELKNTES